MKLLYSRFLFTVFVTLSLAACSPHPGTGVWKATADNKMGIERLVVGFEGRAEFVSKKLDNANWHCFWAKVADKKLSLDCTPSTNSDQSKTFILFSVEAGVAELRDESGLLATFKRLDENPSPKK